MANAKVEVTQAKPNTTDPDVITISESDYDAKGEAYNSGCHISINDVNAARDLLSSSAVKIVTKGVTLTKDDWQKIILHYNNPEDQLIKDNVCTLDLSDAESEEGFTDYGFKDAIACSMHEITTIIWSRYNNIPKKCFSCNKYVTSLTIPNKNNDADKFITVGEDAFEKMEKLSVLSIGNCVNSLGAGMCHDCTSLEKVFFNTPQITEMPSNAFHGCTALKLIDLPYNLTIIHEGAFENCSLETISLPNTLTTIETRAFESCDLQYVVIPKSVTSIKTEAFINNKYLRDVYVMGNNVQCEESAFSVEQICNGFTNTTTTRGTSTEGKIATRDDWNKQVDSDKYFYNSPVVLHFANNDEARTNYRNSFHKMLNSEEALKRLKECQTDDEKLTFVKDYDLTKGEKDYYNVANFPGDLQAYLRDPENQICPFAWYSYQMKNDKGEIENHKCRIWREKAGYYSDKSMQNIGVYAGWKQFLIVQDDAAENSFDDDRRISDMWYSMCFPFDLTANQIRTAYGAGTDVCEFVGAWEKTDAKGKKVITFRFNPILSKEANAALKENQGINQADAVSPVITRANRAYMIHPASKKADDKNASVLDRIIPGIPLSERTGNQNDLVPSVPTTDENRYNSFGREQETLLNKQYKFVGNYQQDKAFPMGCYYFAYLDQNDPNSLVLNYLDTKINNKWTPMTALILPTDKTDTSSAKQFNVFSFAAPTKINGETTGIKDINADKQANNQFRNSNKIYNMNGQVVKEGTSLEGLSKGIYILNGKKYIVK